MGKMLHCLFYKAESIYNKKVSYTKTAGHNDNYSVTSSSIGHCAKVQSCHTPGKPQVSNLDGDKNCNIQFKKK